MPISPWMPAQLKECEEDDPKKNLNYNFIGRFISDFEVQFESKVSKTLHLHKNMGLLKLF